MNLRPFKIGALILLIVSLTTLLCGLGFWQLSRAKQKDALLEQADKGQQHVILGQEALSQTMLAKDLRYHRISLQGHFLNDYTVLLDNKTNNGATGYHVFVPLSLKDNSVILVNQGWIPIGASRSRLPSLPGVKGEVTIEGYLDFAYRNPFIHQALETDSIQWPLRVQQLDLALLQELTGKNIHQMLVVLDNNSPYAFEAQEKIVTTISPARHRGYAFQWFSLAAVLLVLSFTAAYHFRGKA